MPGWDVNSIIAGSNDRRAVYPDVYFLHSGGADYLHDFPAGCSAYNGIVNQHNTLAAQDLPNRIKLYLNSEVADRLLGFNKCTPDIVVTDQADSRGIPLSWE